MSRVAERSVGVERETETQVVAQELRHASLSHHSEVMGVAEEVSQGCKKNAAEDVLLIHADQLLVDVEVGRVAGADDGRLHLAADGYDERTSRLPLMILSVIEKRAPQSMHARNKLIVDATETGSASTTSSSLRHSATAPLRQLVLLNQRGGRRHEVAVSELNGLLVAVVDDHRWGILQLGRCR